MTKHGTLNTYTLDEFIDEEFGVKGTPSRDSFDAEVEAKVAMMEKKDYHVTMATNLHKAIADKASELGQSISSYICSIMERELKLA